MAVRKKAGTIPNGTQTANEATQAAEKQEASQLSSTLGEAINKYKQLAFNVASAMPYSSMKPWVACADDKIEEVLNENRTLLLNLKDIYVLAIIRVIMAIIAFWPISFLLFSSMAILVASLGMLAAGIGGNTPMAFAGVILAAAVILVLLPSLKFLASSAIMHIIAKLAGGKATFTGTSSIILLSEAAFTVLMVPMCLAYALLFGYLIGFLSYAVFAYMVYLQYRGVKHMHALSPKRAAIVVLASLAVEAFLILAVLGVLVFMPYGYIILSKV
ncbi:MAG: YIP1 family protein [Candidatus Micrarchaeota archaeon]|nr:YIP1 family protein [Candidatus Micrarchaeota archaeon]